LASAKAAAPKAPRNTGNPEIRPFPRPDPRANLIATKDPMMRRLLLPLALSFAMQPALAQDTAEAPGPVRHLYLAQDLYTLGLAREDATLLLTAIRLARSTTLRPATGWTRDGEAPSDPAPAPAPTGLPQDPASSAALALALMMAEGNPALADLAADIEAELNRGTLGQGQISTATSRLGPGETDNWRMAFNGQLPAEIAMIGDGSSNLDMTVRDETGADEQGTVICREDGPKDRAFCGFVPLQNGFYIVTVTNRGTAPNLYRLLTN
jgi:hypothetical protein